MSDLFTEGAATTAAILIVFVLIPAAWAYRATLWRFAVILTTVEAIPPLSAWRLASDPDFISIERQRNATRALRSRMNEGTDELVDELNGLYRVIERAAWAFAAVYALAVAVALARGDHMAGIFLQGILCFSGVVVAVETRRRKHR